MVRVGGIGVCAGVLLIGDVSDAFSIADDADDRGIVQSDALWPTCLAKCNGSDRACVSFVDVGRGDCGTACGRAVCVD